MLVCPIPSTYVETCSPVLGPAVLRYGNDVASIHIRICRGLTQKSGLRYMSSIWPWPGAPKVRIRTVQRIGLRHTDKQIEQNAFCCGYNCNTTVNNVFAFGPDGKVFFSVINFPGSWADGALTAHFLAHIKTHIGSYKICVNQGFPQSGDAYGTLVGPLTKRAARWLHRDVQDYYLRISNIHALLRQASEWGMKGLQGAFP